MSPTTCYQFDDHYPNDDGSDYVNFIHSDFNEELYQRNASRSVHLIDELVDESEMSRCFQSDSCFIECTHCSPSAVIAPQRNSTMSELVIYCKEEMSCHNLTVNISKVTVDTVHIECGAKAACSGTSISIDSTSNTQILLNCNATDSCKEVTVNLLHSDNKTEMTAIHNESETFLSANISCFAPYSCHKMEITTNNDRNIRMTLNVYRWSESIHIHHEHWDDITINCGNSEDRRYVEYPISLLNDAEFERLARAEYEDSQSRLPCEDIVIHCGNETHSDRKCEFEYNLDVSISDILQRGDNATCYWMDIYHLYHAECIGECNYPISVHYEDHSFWYELDLIIKGDEDMSHMTRRLMPTEDDVDINWTDSYILCQGSFGDEMKTAETLNTINTIFEDVIHFLVESGSLVHSIKTPPNTQLRSGSVECRNEDNNTIQIYTTFDIVAVEEDDCDSAKVDSLFAADGVFLDRSSKLTEDLIGGTLIYDVFNEGDTFNIGMETSTVLAISGAVAVFVMLISYLIYRLRRSMRSMVIRNPMVIMIAIGEYDGDHINLPVKNDVVNTRKLFGEQLGYDIYPHYGRADIPKLHWTKNEIINLLQDRAHSLAQNLDFHDGLVVVISSHGLNGSIISSDGQHIPKLFIHRIFSMEADMVGLREIPRVFVFDCCDGAFDREQCKREMVEGWRHAGDVTSDVRQETGKVTSIPKVRLARPQWSRDTNPWAKGEHNPDHKLAVVHAANENFASLSRGGIGSYLIYLLVRKLSRNISSWTICRGRRYLGEIVTETQKSLEEHGKQLIVPVYLNGTERIVFEKYQEPLSFADIREPLVKPAKQVLEMMVLQTSVSGNNALITEGDVPNSTSTLTSIGDTPS